MLPKATPKIIGGTKFYERQEIKDVISYLRLLVYPNDDLSFSRIINLPKRGIGDKTIGDIHRYARSHNISMFSALEEMLNSGYFKGKTQNSLQKFVNDFYVWRDMYNGNITESNGDPIHHGKLSQTIIYESGYFSMWQNAKTPDAVNRIENIKELIGTINKESESDEPLPGIDTAFDGVVHSFWNISDTSVFYRDTKRAE